ncbi:MAG: polymer-forming cytoskeletal protein [Candidatus Magasanikbacteria bacterium]|nr:polymer-forming cytoskeletal protein [Candidatus Magasanikbacteria bacterium]
MKKLYLFLLCLLAVFLPLGTAQAFTVKNGTSINVAGGETIADNLYSSSQNLNIDGKIDGDLVCVSSNLTINGEINGDLICAAENITINGKVNGNVRIIGENIVINGQIAKNLNVAGTNFTLNESGEIGKDLLLVNKFSTIKGKIGTDLHGLCQEIVIAGTVGRNVFLRFFNETPLNSEKLITVANNGVINGSLNYSASSLGTIAQNAVIKDGIHHSPIDPKMKKEWQRASSMGNLFSLFAALVMSLVLTSLWGKKVKDFGVGLMHKPGRSIGIGAAIMFATPLVCILLMITLIGIPLALIIFALWLIALYISKILVAIMIGQKLLKKLSPGKTVAFSWVMILGIIVAWMLFSIPVIGWFLALIATWWGLGNMFFEIKEEK